MMEPCSDACTVGKGHPKASSDGIKAVPDCERHSASGLGWSPGRAQLAWIQGLVFLFTKLNCPAWCIICWPRAVCQTASSTGQEALYPPQLP